MCRLPNGDRERSRRFDRKIVLTDVDEIGTNETCKIWSVVDDEWDAVAGGYLASSLQAWQEQGVRQSFLTNLNHVDTTSDCPFKKQREPVAGVGDQVQPAVFEPRHGHLAARDWPGHYDLIPGSEFNHIERFARHRTAIAFYERVSRRDFEPLEKLCNRHSSLSRVLTPIDTDRCVRAVGVRQDGPLTPAEEPRHRGGRRAPFALFHETRETAATPREHGETKRIRHDGGIVRHRYSGVHKHGVCA